jgi:hypothetical protein
VDVPLLVEERRGSEEASSIGPVDVEGWRPSEEVSLQWLLLLPLLLLLQLLLLPVVVEGVPRRAEVEEVVRLRDSRRPRARTIVGGRVSAIGTVGVGDVLVAVVGGGILVGHPVGSGSFERVRLPQVLGRGNLFVEFVPV